MYSVQITHNGQTLILQPETKGLARKIVHLALDAGAQVTTVLNATPKDVDLSGDAPTRAPKADTGKGKGK